MQELVSRTYGKQNGRKRRKGNESGPERVSKLDQSGRIDRFSPRSRSLSSLRLSRLPLRPSSAHSPVSKATRISSLSIEPKYSKLKGLERVIPITIVDWLLDYEKGWSFTDAKAKCSLEPYYGFTHLRQFYLKTASGFAGRVTVPVLWDRKRETICSTESAEIIRMFNSEFNEFSEKPEQRDLDLYPVELREKIDEMNSWMGK